MQPVFALRNIRKDYKGRTALQIGHLEFHPGTIYALAGPNGAGKSTLLELLALLQPPSQGVLEFKGQAVHWRGNDARKGRSRITLVQQSPYLLNRTVYENIAFGLRLRGVHGQSQRDRVAQALHTVDLPDFQNRKAWELSGGESQRVAFARALAIDPEVLLLDAPTSSVCQETTLVLERVIESMRRQGKTVIFSTHDPDQAQRLQSEVVTLDGGRVVDPKPVFHRHPLPSQPKIGRVACGECWS